MSDRVQPQAVRGGFPGGTADEARPAPPPPPPPPQPRAGEGLPRRGARYALAVGAATSAFLLRLALTSLVCTRYTLFYPAVMLAALFGGARPGLLATATAVVFALFWIIPSEHPGVPASSQDVSGLVAFIAVSLLVTLLASSYRRARERLSRLQQDRALRETEDRFRAFFDNAGVGATLIDAAGRFRQVNDRYCRIAGYSREELLGMGPAELSVPEEREHVREHVRRFLSGGAPTFACDKRYLRKDGTSVWVRVTSSLIRDAAGRPVGAAGVIEDITERKRMEDELRASRELLDTIVDSSPSLIFARDLEGKLILLNDRLAEFYGVDKAHALGTRPHDLLPKPIADALVASNREAMRAEAPLQYEEVMSLAGVPRHFVTTKFQLRDARNQVFGVGGVITDVTELKRAEQAVRDSERLYRSLFTLAPSGVVLVDTEGRIIAFNEQAQKQLGYAADEFSRLHVSDIDVDETRDGARARIARVRRTGGEDFDARHRTKSGALRDVRVKLRPVEVGDRTCLLALWEDVTDARQAEAALREADRRKSEFLAILSHELRNPTASIRNALYLLERVPADGERGRGAVAAASRQVRHLARLIDDLLDVTRISHGKIELRRSCLDARDVVRRTCDDHAGDFTRRGVDLRLDLSADPVWIRADATRMAQIVGNLLHNAGKFTPEHGIVTVSLKDVAHRAELRVRDTGVGIAPELLSRVFEPFVQGGPAAGGGARGGLGLGLALVRWLVELHGGTVHASSEGAHRGTEFVVTLPLDAPPAHGIGERPAARDGRKLSVLVIEDDLDAGATLLEVLEVAGHQPHLAVNGRTGITRAKELRPDVILCDIGLPDIDGYDVARALRGCEELRSIRLLALSGYAQPDDKRRAREAGFDAHLAKAASLEELEELMTRA